MTVLTVKEAAELLKVSPGCVYQLIAERRIPHLRIGVGRGCIRIRRQDLEQFLENCGVDVFSLARSQ